jgi:hypothetical protein
MLLLLWLGPWDYRVCWLDAVITFNLCHTVLGALVVTFGPSGVSLT